MLLCLLPVASPAQTTAPDPATPAQTAEPVEETSDFVFRGYVQGSYSHNFNNPTDGRNLYHGYDELTQRLRFDMLELDFGYGLDQPNHTGFRLDMVGGYSMPRIDAALGLFRDPYTGFTNTHFDIRQAFLSHTFENGLRVDAGKFASHVGYEVMDGVDGRNPNGTRALTFSNNPFTHTGLKVFFPIDDTLSVTGLAVLGADNFQDTNRSLSFGAQVNYHPTEDFSLIANAFVGPEQVRNDAATRQFYEFIANYRINEVVTLGVDLTTATEQGLGANGGTAHYNSQVFYWLNTITEEFSINLRQEFFNDPEGARLSPFPARVSGFTVTPEYRITPDWVVRIDFRFDRADRPVFNRHGTLVDCQNTFFLGQSLKF